MLKLFESYDAISNDDLILIVGAGMKASSCFFHVLLVFCHKRESDVLVKVKLVQRVTNVQTYKGEILLRCSFAANIAECSTSHIHFT